MAKTLDSFAPSPVFAGTAQITVAGKGKQPLKLRFKFHEPKSMKAVIKKINGAGESYKPDESGDLSDEDFDSLKAEQAQALLEILDGWEFADAFNAENLQKFIARHTFAYGEIISAFYAEHMDAKAKN